MVVSHLNRLIRMIPETALVEILISERLCPWRVQRLSCVTDISTLSQGSRRQACTPGPMSLAPYLVRSQRFVWLGAEFCYTFYFFEAVNLALLTDISTLFQGSRSEQLKSIVEAYPLPSGEGGEVLLVCAKSGWVGELGAGARTCRTCRTWA